MTFAGLIDPDRAAALLDIRNPQLFAERLLHLAHSAAGVEELFAYRVGEGAPETLASSSDLGDAEERIRAYSRRFHRSDPAVAARLQASPETGFSCRVSASDIELGAYRRLCFDQPRFAEKICFGWRGDDHSLIVTFYQRKAGRDLDMAQLGALAQIAITGLARLAAPAEKEASPVDEIQGRLSEAYPVLTLRETQVCARTLAGRTARQIAQELGLGQGTVLTYRQRAYQKLGVSKANDLLATVMH